MKELITYSLPVCDKHEGKVWFHHVSSDSICWDSGCTQNKPKTQRLPCLHIFCLRELWQQPSHQGSFSSTPLLFCCRVGALGGKHPDSAEHALFAPQLQDEDDPIYNKLPSLPPSPRKIIKRSESEWKKELKGCMEMMEQSSPGWRISTSVCVALRRAWKRTVSEWLNISLLRLNTGTNGEGRG